MEYFPCPKCDTFVPIKVKQVGFHEFHAEVPSKLECGCELTMEERNKMGLKIIASQIVS